MPKKLAAVTTQDAIEEAFGSVMGFLYSTLGTIVAIVPCLTEEGHGCFYSVIVEKGWLLHVEEGDVEQVDGPEVPPNSMFKLTKLGGDEFCRQHLLHTMKEGPVYEVLKEAFERYPEELKWWKNEVRQARLEREIA